MSWRYPGLSPVLWLESTVWLWSAGHAEEPVSWRYLYLPICWWVLSAGVSQLRCTLPPAQSLPWWPLGPKHSKGSKAKRRGAFHAPSSHALAGIHWPEHLPWSAGFKWLAKLRSEWQTLQGEDHRWSFLHPSSVTPAPLHCASPLPEVKSPSLAIYKSGDPWIWGTHSSLLSSLFPKRGSLHIVQTPLAASENERPL